MADQEPEPVVDERATCQHCGIEYPVDESTWQQTRCPECGSWNDRPAERGVRRPQSVLRGIERLSTDDLRVAADALEEHGIPFADLLRELADSKDHHGTATLDYRTRPIAPDEWQAFQGAIGWDGGAPLIRGIRDHVVAVGGSTALEVFFLPTTDEDELTSYQCRTPPDDRATMTWLMDGIPIGVTPDMLERAGWEEL